MRVWEWWLLVCEWVLSLVGVGGFFMVFDSGGVVGWL